MQNSTPQTRVHYRERLTPSLWLLVSAAVVGPMVAFTLVPFGSAVALVIGITVAVLVLVAFVSLSPAIAVHDGVLRAGRAHIDVRWLGDAVALTEEDARQARGPKLPARGWHLIRPGIDGVVIVQNTDPDDPVTTWTLSSRTPDRLAAAINNARIITSH